MASAKDRTIGSLLETRQSCVLSCQECELKTRISGLEAIASYGGLMRFSEVSIIIRQRCRKPGNGKQCWFSVSPSPDGFMPEDRDAQWMAGNATRKTPR